MLCYSNYAATRMTLGRIRDALGDCMMAAAIDPNFLNVQVRASKCYLALGEVDGASQHLRRCLQLVNDVYVGRKIAVEASDGLQNAQKLSELLSLSAELLLWKTSTNAERALELIAEGLIINPSSEKLLEMKAEALFALRRYEEVIELCEHTFSSAEKNNLSIETNDQAACSDSSELSKYFYFRLRRCHMIVKSYFYLGKLEEGLASLEKHEEKVSTNYRNWRETVQLSEPLFSLYVNFCLIRLLGMRHLRVEDILKLLSIILLLCPAMLNHIRLQLFVSAIALLHTKHWARLLMLLLIAVYL